MEYSRFYALFKLLPKEFDPDEMKSVLVGDASGGRTTSLRELTREEYRSLCERMDELVGQRKMLRKQRSVVLRKMTAMGIDTSDWANVDRFCTQPRIAGKAFRYLDYTELCALARKLNAIDHKRVVHGRPLPTAHVVVMPQDLNTSNQIPS